MDNSATNVELLYEKAKKYTLTSFNLFALNSVDKSADVLSSLTSRLIIAMVVAMFTLFINIGLGFFIGKFLNEYYLGFFIVSLFYLIIAIVLYMNKDKFIKEPMANLIIAKLLKPNKSGFSIVNDIKVDQHEDVV